jgi:hypothetical protein
MERLVVEVSYRLRGQADKVFEPDETSGTNPPTDCAALVGGGEPAFPDVALSWRLTGCEVSRLKEAIRGGEGSPSCADRRRFQAWWNAHKPAYERPLAVQCPPDPL